MTKAEALNKLQIGVKNKVSAFAHFFEFKRRLRNAKQQK